MFVVVVFFFFVGLYNGQKSRPAAFGRTNTIDRPAAFFLVVFVFSL